MEDFYLFLRNDILFTLPPKKKGKKEEIILHVYYMYLRTG